MITKRTRVLSFVATLLMLVSMLACFVIPASASDDTLAMYNAIAADAETDPNGLGAALDGGETDPAVLAAKAAGMTFKADAKPRYAWHTAYTAAGYTGKVWSIDQAYDLYRLMYDFTDAMSGYTIVFTDDIDMNDLTTDQYNSQQPIGKGINVYSATIDGRNHKISNLKMVFAAGTTRQTAMGLISGMNGTIKNLGIENGYFENSGTTNDAKVGAFTGQLLGSAKNCWFSGMVKTNSGSSSVQRGYGVSVFGDTPKGAIIDHCLNLGTIQSTKDNVAAFSVWNGVGSAVCNSIDAGTLISAVGTPALALRHGNGFTSAEGAAAMPSNSYSVNYNLVSIVGTSANACVGTLPNGSTMNATSINEYYDVNSAGEAAYKANKEANYVGTFADRTVFYSIDANGKLFLGNADNQVRKLNISGNEIDDATDYKAQGSSVSFVSLGLQDPETVGVTYAVTKASDGVAVAVENGAFTVPADDVNIVATYDASIALNTAKADLQVVINEWAAIDAALLTETSAAALTTFRTNAAAAMAGEDKAAVEAAITEGEGLSIALNNTYPTLPQFKDYAIYDPYNTANKWLIKEAEDWTDAVAMGTAADVLSAEFHLAENIDVSAANVEPLGYGDQFTGLLDGHDHTITVNISKAAEHVTGKGIALISSINGATIKNIGVAGTVSGTGSASGYVGGIAGYIKGGAKVIHCWNKATITADVSSSDYTTGGIVGGTRDNGGTIDGCINYGAVTATGGGAANGIIGYTANNVKVYNSLNLGTVSVSEGTDCVGAAVRPHANLLGTALYKPFKLEDSLIYAASAADGEATTQWANQPIFNTYNSKGDVIEGRSSDNTANVTSTDVFVVMSELFAVSSDAEAAYMVNNNYYPSTATGAALKYLTLDASGNVAYGTVDNQVRKVSFEGALTTPIYLNAGTADYDLAALAPGATFEIVTENAESTLDATGTKLTLANEDITIKVTGETVDNAVYEAAKADLEAFVQINATLFSNEGLADAISAAEAALAAVAEDDSVANKKAVIAQAEAVNAISLTLAEGKKVPFAGKDDLYKDVAANGEYGIYSVEDWNAFATGARSGKVYLMNNLTLPADAKIIGTAALGCTFDGQDNTLTVDATISINNITAHTGAGILGTSATISNLTIAGKVQMNVGTEAPTAKRAYAAVFCGSGGTFTNCVNKATVTATVAGNDRLWIGGIGGETGTYVNCTNEGNITVTGYGNPLAVGGIAGRTNARTNKNLKNTGAIVVNDTYTEAGRETCVGGIFGSSAGDVIDGAWNTGSITVNGGYTVYAAGIQSIGSGNLCHFKGELKNEGAVTVIAKEGATVYAAGIMGCNGYPMTGTISNSGAIIVDAKNAAAAHVAGIVARFNAYAVENVASTEQEKVYVADFNTKELTATNTGDLWLGGVKEASANHTVEQITGDTQVTKTEGCVASATMASVCEHNLGDTVPATETTHTILCNDAFNGIECSFSEEEECTYADEIKHTEAAIYDADTLTAKHTAVCACGREKEADCAFEKHAATCTEDLYFTFTCGRDTLTVADTALDHDFEGQEWIDDEVDPNKEYQLCKNGCGTKNYRIKGSVAVNGISMNANKDDGVITITLPELTAGKITLTLTGAGYEIIGVTGATETAVDNVYDYAAAEITVTIKTAKTVVADGVLKVDLTEAKKGDEVVGDASAEAIISFVAIDGDADANSTLTLGDALATLYYVVGDGAYKAAHPINTYNANLYYEGGSRDDGIINVQDAHAIVRKWLKEVQF